MAGRRNRVTSRASFHGLRKGGAVWSSSKVLSPYISQSHPCILLRRPCQNPSMPLLSPSAGWLLSEVMCLQTLPKRGVRPGKWTQYFSCHAACKELWGVLQLQFPMLIIWRRTKTSKERNTETVTQPFCAFAAGTSLQLMPQTVKSQRRAMSRPIKVGETNSSSPSNCQTARCLGGRI